MGRRDHGAFVPRVDAERIDAVLNLVGELIIGKSMMQQVLNDLEALVAAVQANDEAAATKATSALDADGKAITGFDTTVIDKADEVRFQPLIDAYNRQMKIASGI